MTTHDLARTLDAVANQRPVVAGVTSERRRAIGADAQTLVDRESAGDGVVRWRRRIQPQHTEDA
jgi:thiamine pyrophosphate-dependent acetolactate synthase large subunit-like protein